MPTIMKLVLVLDYTLLMPHAKLVLDYTLLMPQARPFTHNEPGYPGDIDRIHPLGIIECTLV